jgi:hypothetical protein
MITTNKLPIPGGYLVTGFYRTGKLPKIINKITSDESRADSIIKQIKRDALQDKVAKYLNFREHIMDHRGGLRTMDKYKAITILRNNLAYLSDKPLESNCKLVIDCEELLKSILPGKESLFHQSQKDVLFEILSFCQLEIKIKL